MMTRQSLWRRRQFLDGGVMTCCVKPCADSSRAPSQIKPRSWRLDQTRFRCEEVLSEAHDALLALNSQDRPEEYLRRRFQLERPIDFTFCTLGRGPLTIPCEVKVGQTMEN
jgi:hypothetical protein